MLFQLLLAARPRQWVKNLFVLPALVFSRHLFEYDYLRISLGGVCSFWLLSGGIYLLNDLFDLEQDPGELASRSSAGDSPTEALQDWIAAISRNLNELDQEIPEPLDEESIERLRALGYAD